MNKNVLENCLMHGLEAVRMLFPNADCTIEAYAPVGQPIVACLSAIGEKYFSDATAKPTQNHDRAVGVQASRQCSRIPLVYGGEILGSLEVTSQYSETAQQERPSCAPIADFLASALFHARMAEQYEEMALLDPKTGLFSYTYFVMRAHEAIAAYQRAMQGAMQATAMDGSSPVPVPFSVVVADGDGFGKLNGRYGHVVVDRLLRAVADFLRDRLRAGDTLARLSGGADELLFLLPETDFAGANALIRALQSALDCHSFTISCPSSDTIHDIQIGFSFGVVEFNNAMRDTEDVVQRVSRAMYEDKRSRRGKIAA